VHAALADRLGRQQPAAGRRLLEKPGASAGQCGQGQTPAGASWPGSSPLTSLGARQGELCIAMGKAPVVWTRSCDRVHPGQEDAGVSPCVPSLQGTGRLASSSPPARGCLEAGGRHGGRRRRQRSRLPSDGSCRNRVKQHGWKKFFTMRMVKHWNGLPREVVEAPSLETFKTRLDRTLSNLI